MLLMMKINMIDDMLADQLWDQAFVDAFRKKQDEYRKQLSDMIEFENAVQHNETIRRCQSEVN